MVKEKKYTIIFLCTLLITFILGYSIGSNKVIKGKSQSKIDNSYSSLNVNSKNSTSGKILNKVVPKSAEIIFEMKSDNNNSNKYIIERRKSVEDEKIVGMKGSKLEEKYKEQGYVLKSINKDRVEMIREPIVYQPNSYILLSQNNEIIIAKSNEKGSIFDNKGNLIERQGTGTKLECLRSQDIKNIINGDKSIQYKSSTELNDSIKDFDIRYELPE